MYFNEYISMKKISFLKDYLIDQSIIENRKMKHAIPFFK